MTLPNVTISKATFTTSQAPASSDGVLAIVACSSIGTVDTPGGYGRTDGIITAFGYGPLTEFAAYDIAVANQPVVLVKGTAGFPGAYGTITKTIASGASTVVATAATYPFDTYNASVTVTAAFTAGVTGGKYTYSVDGQENVSGEQALGTALTLTIPNTGLSFDLTGVFAVGDTWQVYTSRPKLSNTNITTALAALGVSRLPFEGCLIDCSATTSTVGLIDTILAAWEAKGVFKFAMFNSRFKTEPAASGETEAAYATALGLTYDTQTSIRVCVGADGARTASPITGWDLKRPTAMFIAARAMGTPIGEDPAYIGRGALIGARVSGTDGNPLDHDEDINPNLDAHRLMSLRTFAPGGPEGVYCCNANSIQPTGGAFPYLQHIRIMNRACTIAWAVLTRLLSVGVRKNPKKDPVTGAVTIFEPDASRIEDSVNEAMVQPLKGQVSAAKFTISRTDDLSAVPCIVTGTLSIVALAYIKGFQITSQFSKTIQTAI